MRIEMHSGKTTRTISRTHASIPNAPLAVPMRVSSRSPICSCVSRKPYDGLVLEEMAQSRHKTSAAGWTTAYKWLINGRSGLEIRRTDCRRLKIAA
jgi:hypothetical protein